MMDLRIDIPVLSAGDIVGEEEIIDNKSCCRNHQNHKALRLCFGDLDEIPGYPTSSYTITSFTAVHAALIVILALSREV